MTYPARVLPLHLHVPEHQIREYTVLWLRILYGVIQITRKPGKGPRMREQSIPSLFSAPAINGLGTRLGRKTLPQAHRRLCVTVERAESVKQPLTFKPALRLRVERGQPQVVQKYSNLYAGTGKTDSASHIYNIGPFTRLGRLAPARQLHLSTCMHESCK